MPSRRAQRGGPQWGAAPYVRALPSSPRSIPPLSWPTIARNRGKSRGKAVVYDHGSVV